MMGTRVVFVGRSVPPGGRARGWTQVRREHLTAARVRALAPVILVLGDEILDAMVPPAFEAIVRSACVRTFGSPDRSGPETIARWARATSTEFVSSADLEDRIAVAAGKPLRTPVDPVQWLGPVRRSARASRLLDSLTGLDVPRPAEWRRALGMSRHQLRRVVTRTFGHSPVVVCARYLVATARAARTEGLTWDAVAASCGYSDAPTLLRRLRRAGRIAACDDD